MRLNYSLFVLVLLAACLKTGKLYAQEGQTEQPRGWMWKGLDVTEVIDNSQYATSGKKFYLYNMGTGRFIIEGGNWGMEGRLFHEDFGRPLYLMSDGYMNSGITEEYNASKHVFGCNVPKVSKTNGEWLRDYNKYSFTCLMDVYQKALAPWTFQRVETDPNAETYTYYIWERMQKMPNMPGYVSEGNDSTNYYLGAAYGECHVTKEQNPDGKGDGKLVFLDDDRSCWTTAEILDNSLNQTTYTVNDEQVTLGELYQWRLISEEEFIQVLNDIIIKINPSVSSLIPDRDFCRNSEVFDSSWKMEGQGSGSTGRLGYTWGIYHGKNGQNAYYDNQAWDKPLRLKGQFGDGSTGIGMKDSKYGFLSFEGVGRTYAEFEVPRQGWYEVQCYGFVQSRLDHDAYLFAKVKGSNSESSYGGISKTKLTKVDWEKFKDKNTEAGFLEVGKELTKNGEAYKSTLWICVTAEQFESGQVTLQVGVEKNEATQSAATQHNGKDYYYDTDWVCVDDFRATYMGEAPVFFYEDEESLDYLNLSGEPQQHNQAFMDPNENGHYSGAVCLERTFKKDQWNSFSFPLPLTGVQIREAFGNNAVLAKLNSIGEMSQNPNVIDFETVSLKTTNTVVEPGNFYLLKPTADPVKGIDSRGDEAEFYQMGRMFFSINEEESDSETFPFLDLTKWNDGTQTFTGETNNGIASVNYVQTAKYKDFKVNSDGSYIGTVDNNIYAPNGAYVVSNNTIFHINKDTRLKGFRGWLTLDTPIPPSGTPTMAVNGKFTTEGTETAIGELPIRMQLPSSTAVYDISGRRIGTIGMNLSKGLYIVNGKKYLVK